MTTHTSRPPIPSPPRGLNVTSAARSSTANRVRPQPTAPAGRTAATVERAAKGGEQTGRAASPMPEAMAREVARAVKGSIARCGMPDLDDLEQMTWVRLLERLDTAPEIVSMKGFAKGVAMNVIREQKRALMRMRQLDGNDLFDVDELCPDNDPLVAESLAEHHELAAQLDRAKLQLSPSDRWLIDARFLEEASYADMLPRFWQRFGRPIRTTEGLRTAVFHARAQLVEALESAVRAEPQPSIRALRRA